VKCFSFPPENSRIKDRKSRCRYQNNLPAAHRVFLNYQCQKATNEKFRPETTDTAGKSRPSGARKGKARKSRQITTDTAGKFGCQYTVKRVDLVTQDQNTQVSKKVSDIHEENFTVNIELFQHFSQVWN
jgi:hypothetical protein